MKNILIYCAFPYANGSLHIGHIMEHVYADIWVKHQRLLGINKIYFNCSDDTHGTAILLKSRELNIQPQCMINRYYRSHLRDFKLINIIHDNYHTTHSNENYLLLLKFLNILIRDKLIYIKNIYQFYDVKLKMFLSDRLIKGQCSQCKSFNQYSDICNNCGNTYKEYGLLHPISILSNSIPILKLTKQVFMKISSFKNCLIKWLSVCHLQKIIFKQLNIWLKTQLCDWNITRDIPYFGFQTPNFLIINKFIYVWLDALLGYISNFQYYCKNNNIHLFNLFWEQKSDDYKIYYIFGKDILYHHGILLPIILNILHYNKPSKLFVHGHLLINYSKISKSTNNVITIKKWLKYFDSDSLRYYLASKLSMSVKDINFNIYDFITKINTGIVNKFVNIASRISKFFIVKFDNYLADKLYNCSFYDMIVNQSGIISYYFNSFNYKKVLNIINNLLDSVNIYINEYKPWLLFHNDSKKKQLHRFCTTIINIFRIISIYLFPIVPDLCKRIEIFLNIELTWHSLKYPLLNHKILTYQKLYNKLDISCVKHFL